MMDTRLPLSVGMTQSIINEIISELQIPQIHLRELSNEPMLCQIQLIGRRQLEV